MAEWTCSRPGRVPTGLTKSNRIITNCIFEELQPLTKPPFISMATSIQTNLEIQLEYRLLQYVVYPQSQLRRAKKETMFSPRVYVGFFGFFGCSVVYNSIREIIAIMCFVIYTPTYVFGICIHGYFKQLLSFHWYQQMKSVGWYISSISVGWCI